MRRRGRDGLNKGRWSKTEHELFLRGLRQFGRNWEVISGLLKTRSVLQIRTHAQKYFRNVERGLPFPENPYDDDEEAEEEEEEGEEGGGGGGDDVKEDRGQAAAASAQTTTAWPTPHPSTHPAQRLPSLPLPFAHAGAQSPFFPPFRGPPGAFSLGDGHGYTPATAAAAAAGGGARAAPAFGGDAAFLPGGGYGAPSALVYQQQQQQQQQRQQYHHPQQQLLQPLASWEAGGGWGAGPMPVPMAMQGDGKRLSPPLGDWPDDLDQALLLAATSAMDGEHKNSSGNNVAGGGRGSGLAHASRQGPNPNFNGNPASGGGGGGGGGGAGRVAWQGYNSNPNPDPNADQGQGAGVPRSWF